MVYLSLVTFKKSVVFDVESNKMIQMSVIEFNYFALICGVSGLIAIAFLLEDLSYSGNDFGVCTSRLIMVITSKINEFLSNLIALVFNKRVKNKIVLVVDNLLPVSISAKLEPILSDNDLTELTKRSLFIVCRSRGGKTTFLKYYLYTLINSGVNIQLSICDINYGKPSDDGVVNNWMGISPDVIFSTSSTIFAAIEGYGDELKKRKSECEKAIRAGSKVNPIANKPIYLLVIEELVATRIDLINCEMWDSVIKIITDGLVCGLGYGCPIVVVSQFLAVSQTDINLAMRDQFNIIALGKSASNSEVIKDCGFDDVDVTKAKVKSLQNAKKRPILISGIDESKVAILPDLRWIDDVEIQYLNINKDDVWWSEVYLNNEQNQQWLFDRIEAYLHGKENSITSSTRVNELVNVFGVKPNRQDVRYVNYIKPEIERITERLKSEQH